MPLNSLDGNSVGCAVIDSALKDFKETKLKPFLLFLSEMLFAIAGALA